MKDSTKYFCVNSAVPMIIEELKKKYPRKSYKECLEEFLSSNTYALMCDLKTRYWAESPLYVFYEYLDEIHKRK